MSFKPESYEVSTEGLISDALVSSETVTQTPGVYLGWDYCQCLIENCFVKKAQCIKTLAKSNKSGNLVTGALRSSLGKKFWKRDPVLGVSVTKTCLRATCHLWKWHCF